jgi:hypothetical protein
MGDFTNDDRYSTAVDATALSSSERCSDDHHAGNDVVAGDGFCDPGRRRGSDS